MGAGAGACTPAPFCLRLLVFVLPLAYVQANPLAPCRLTDETEMVAVVEVIDDPYRGSGARGYMVGGGMNIADGEQGLDALQSGILFVTGVDPRTRSKPLEPHCVFRLLFSGYRYNDTVYVYRLELSDLSDHKAEYWRDRKPQRKGLATLGNILDWAGREPWVHLEWIQEGVPVVADRNPATGQLEGGATAAGTAGDENHYLAVATSPPAGWRIEAGESGHFGIGWHAESHHDAGMSAAFSGKYEGTVVEHSCEIVRIMCAGGHDSGRQQPGTVSRDAVALRMVP